MKNMPPSGNYFYINGDSWMAHFSARIANSDHPLFKNTVVINHAVPGCGNASIIRRTKHALEELKKSNIYPTVCVGLTEVGRDFNQEFCQVRPQQDLTEYLKSVLSHQMHTLEQFLTDHPHYVSTAWVTDPAGKKSLTDFIEQDFSQCSPVYTVGNGIYKWLDDRRNIFKFSKSSFVEAVENKQIFENLLLNNKYVNETLHLDKSTSDVVYERFFTHVFSTIRAAHDN
jgi:hypothetical protein